MPNIKGWKINDTVYTLGIIAKPTAADEGKIPMVDQNGDIVWVSIPNAESEEF